MLKVGKLYTVDRGWWNVYDWRGLNDDDNASAGKPEVLGVGELLMVLEHIPLKNGFRAKLLRENGSVKYLRVTETDPEAETSLTNCFVGRYLTEVSP